MALYLRKIIPLSAAIAAFWANVLFAGTYFVDQGLGSASDANAGSENAPWLTIQTGPRCCLPTTKK